MAAFFPLALQRSICTLPQLLGGGAVPRGINPLQFFSHACGKSGIGQGQYGNGAATQHKPQFRFAVGQFQEKNAPGLSEMGAPAVGVGGGVRRQEQQFGPPRPAHSAHRLFPYLQPPCLFGQT